jgi:hypothetical protein
MCPVSVTLPLTNMLLLLSYFEASHLGGGAFLLSLRCDFLLCLHACFGVFTATPVRDRESVCCIGSVQPAAGAAMSAAEVGPRPVCYPHARQWLR